MNPVRDKLAVAVILFVAAAVFFTGIHWGLPTRATDQFLLRQPAYAMRLEQLTSEVPEVDSAHGADVVAPSGPADAIVPLSTTESQKAQILCRYRLYSFQPDEMITFRSLSQMKPGRGDLDPRLYQYGGLWIYGVGAIIEAGHLFGLLNIADRATYIGNPELFASFYVATRAYSAAWGILGAWAVFAITRRYTGGLLVPMLAALTFVAAPVVIITAHEAKPHLAGMVLILLAVLAADNYVRTPSPKWMCLTGLLCGAAAGMVLWATVSLVVIVAMAILARRPAVIVYATIAAFAVFAITNPYVIYHLFFDRAILASNLANTSAMYNIGRPDLALLRAVGLAIAGAGPIGFIAGLIGAAVCLKRGRAPLAVLLACVALAAFLPYAVMAAGKPGEYGRFALLPDVALLIAAAAALRSRRGKIVIMIGLFFLTALFGRVALFGFIRDADPAHLSSRWNTAVELQKLLDQRTAEYAHLHRMGQSTPFLPTLGLFADPAPYDLPPVDLNGWRIVRLPRDYDPTNGLAVADYIVRPTETRWQIFARNPISWADKKFEIIPRTLADRLAYEAVHP